MSHVLQNLDVEYLYEAPLAMEGEKLADVVLETLRLENRKPDLTDWQEMVRDMRIRKGKSISPSWGNTPSSTTLISAW